MIAVLFTAVLFIEALFVAVVLLLLQREAEPLPPILGPHQ